MRNMTVEALPIEVIRNLKIMRHLMPKPMRDDITHDGLMNRAAAEWDESAQKAPEILAGISPSFHVLLIQHMRREYLGGFDELSQAQLRDLCHQFGGTDPTLEVTIPTENTEALEWLALIS